LLALAKLKKRRDATLLPQSDQLERVFAGSQCAPCDLQLHVQLEQVEVGAGDVADECGGQRLAILVAGEQVSPRRFCRAAQPAPDINFEREKVESHGPECPSLVGALRNDDRAACGAAHG
jgi:hypothetical protein